MYISLKECNWAVVFKDFGKRNHSFPKYFFEIYTFITINRFGESSLAIFPAIVKVKLILYSPIMPNIGDIMSDKTN